MLCRLTRVVRGVSASESARRAARRAAQISRLRDSQHHQHHQHHQHLQRSPAVEESEATPAERASNTTDAGAGLPSQRLWRGSSASRDGLPTPSALSPGGSPTRTDVVEANRTYKRVLQGRGAESSLQREARTAIRHAPTREAALEAFLLLARSGSDGGGGVTAQALREVSTVLVTHHVQAEMGREAYALALQDAVGSSEDRWSSVSPEESRAFALYQCARLERHAVKGLSFNEAAGMTLEGRDNDTVALIEYQIDRYTREVAPVPTDVLADLMHLDVSWNAALRLYETARAQRGVDPPVEMSNRLMGLMTCYRSEGIGSRPWQQALSLYNRVIHSGYDTTLSTYSLALDALWRSGDSFHKQRSQRTVGEADRNRIWRSVVRVRAQMEEAGLSHSISGDEGCLYYESLIKAVCAAGKVDVAVRLLEEMEGEREDTSFRLLLPTAESYAFVMAACNAAGNAADAEAVHALFRRHYSLSDLHPEVLLVYLQSLRNVTSVNATVGAQVEELVLPTTATSPPQPRDAGGGRGRLLDRPCSVASLQLLAARSVKLPGPRRKSDLATLLYNAYDAGVWLQEPLARKVELQTVLRCCFLIALEESKVAAEPVEQSGLMRHVEAKLRSVFGLGSPELEWLADTEVYGLDGVEDWQHALRLFTRQVLERPPEKLKYLPIPLRQVREMVVTALLRCCHVSAGAAGVLAGERHHHHHHHHSSSRCAAKEDDHSFLFLDDDAQEAGREEARTMAERTLKVMATEVYRDVPAAAQPCTAVAELLLIQALCGDSVEGRRALGMRAMWQLGLSDAASISPRAMSLVGRALDLTPEHVESVLTDGHARLRATALTQLSAGGLRLHLRGHPVERIYL